MSYVQPSRGPFGTNRWEYVTDRSPLRKGCPRCGAKPYRSCFNIKTLRVTGQDQSLPDPSYPVMLKNPHRERRS